MPHGHGVYCYACGASFDGEHAEGVRHGAGTPRPRTHALSRPLTCPSHPSPTVQTLTYFSSLSPSRTSHTHGPSRPLIIVTGKLQLRSGVVVVATWQKGQVHGAGRIVYGSGCEWRGARERV